MDMNLRRLPLRDLNFAPYNPRLDLKPGDLAYEKLKRSILEFGFVEVPVWNSRTKNLVAGHQRLKVLREMGIGEIDVCIVDLPIEKEKALNLALNQIRGGWDQIKLAELLEELTKIPDFDATLTGFDIPDIQAAVAEMLDTKLQDKEEHFDLEKDLEIEGPAITKAGDILELGRHRVLCGDSSKPEDVQKAVNNAKIHILFTDPPYNVSYLGGERPIPEKARPKRSRLWRRIYNDNLSQEDYEHWLGKVLENIKSALIPGAPAYLWNGHRQFAPMYRIATELGFKISCVITWAKPNFAIGYGDYNQQTEFCLYGWLEENGAHRWFGPANESTLWEVKRDPTKDYIHPTQKPLELAERALRNSSKPGDTVLDTFLGSGTTLIAAERTGRKCIGVELDPRYCDAIVRRYIAFVGQDNAPPELVARYRQPAGGAQ